MHYLVIVLVDTDEEEDVALGVGFGREVVLAADGGAVETGGYRGEGGVRCVVSYSERPLVEFIIQYIVAAFPGIEVHPDAIIPVGNFGAVRVVVEYGRFVGYLVDGKRVGHQSQNG